MDALRLMLVSLLIGATVSTSPAQPTDAAVQQAEPKMAIAQQAAGATPKPLDVVVLSPAPQAGTPTPAASPTIRVIMPSATAPLPSGGTSSSSSSSVKKISTGTSITRELYKSCKGDDVRTLQSMLKGLDYSVSADGTFGTQTRNAVIAFQKNNGLKADGIAGALTIRKMAGNSAVPASGSRSILSYGMKGQDVRELQTRLAELGYYSDKVSGNYLTNTRAGVRWFQQVNGLSVDGVAGPSTQSRLYSVNAIGANQKPYPTAAPGGFYRTLRIGMSGNDVTYLQQLLKNLGYFTGSTTNYFGTNTEWAVTTFQSYNGLYADGVAGTSTQQKLLRGDAVPYSGYYATHAPVVTNPPYVVVTPVPTLPPVGGGGMVCSQCGRTYESSMAGYHSVNTHCAHYVCVNGLHRGCILCGRPECNPGTCNDPANATGMCVYN